MKKLDTIDLKGKEYATVPTRIKEFRSDCPNGLIETTPQILASGQIIFKARVVKDKSDEYSAEWTGHSLGGSKSEKDFEKLETIAIGRALAVLWYMASGDVASSEEMEEFVEYQKTKKEEELEYLLDELQYIDSIEKLKDFYIKNKGKWKEFDKAVSEKKALLLTKKQNENP